MPTSIETQLYIKELELNSLIDTIKLINTNASDKDLYRIYKFSLHGMPLISKMLLYVLEEDWVYKTSFNTTYDYKNILIAEEILGEDKSAALSEVMYFSEFDQVIPIRHHGKVIAYTFFGLNKDADQGDAAIDLEFLEVLCQIIIANIEDKKIASREMERQGYRAQLEIAHEVQTLLFPKTLPYSNRRQVYANYLPHHRVGGDYYDYIDLDDGSFLMCVADVSGKGVPAALLMSNFQAGLRLLAKQRHSLTTIIEELNALVMDNAQGANFITAFFLLYDAPSKTIRYINAGHNPPFIRVKEEWHRMEEGTTIIGGFDELPFLTEGAIEQADQFFVFTFTDGFIENYDESNGIFGEDRLLDFLKEYYTLELPELHQKLIDELQQFAGGAAYADDVTLLSCRVL